jgi:RNA polymerase sigma factor (sigma-70 family)
MSILGWLGRAGPKSPDVSPDRTPSFPSLYRRFLRPVLRAVRRAGVPERHCEDVAQDVFVAVHQSLPRYDPARRIEPWLMTIAYRTALDHLRRADRRELPEGEIETMETTRADDAERLTAAREAERIFHELCAGLDPDRRVVFLMSEIDDLKLADIAEALGIPAGTAASRLARAREDFAAAVERRRAAEARRLGGAHMLPVFLASTDAIFEAGRTLPEVSARAASRLWGRIARATAGSALAGALAKLALVTPAAVVAALLGALSVGAVIGGLAVYAATRPRGGIMIAAVPGDVAPAGSLASGGEAPAASATATTTASAAMTPDAGARSGADPAASERAERALLEAARAALQRGDAAGALRELSRHAQRFPRGVYAEEREALKIRASALAAGQDAGAKQ